MRTIEELINIIKQKGYWKIIIRPVEFEEKRIGDKDTCEKIIKECKISLRGWDYPHIDYKDYEGGIFSSGLDSISSSRDWPNGGHFEFWRFYQNGQFIHYFSMDEDYRMEEEDKKKVIKSFFLSKLDKKIDRFFSVLHVLYSITEVYIFSANLLKRVNFGEEIEIIIELGNVEGRVLFFWGDFSRKLFQIYMCRYQPIVVKRIIKSSDLITNTTELALDLTMDIFKEFNWKDPDKNVFAIDQKKFVERRL